MLHFLGFMCMMLTLAPLGFAWASAITWLIAIAKEVYDLWRKSNNLKQSANDIIRDAIGWGGACITMLIW